MRVVRGCTPDVSYSKIIAGRAAVFMVGPVVKSIDQWGQTTLMKSLAR